MRDYITSKELADRTGIEHRHLTRTINELKLSFPSCDIKSGIYTTKQNKKMNCFLLSGRFLRYLVQSRRNMTSTPERLAESNNILQELGIESVVITRLTDSSEDMFYEIMKRFFNDDVVLVRQYAVMGYRVDFYLPEINLMIEFDEKHHDYGVNKHNDAKREIEIKSYFKSMDEEEEVKIIRVKEGREIESLRDIVSYMYERDNICLLR